MDVDIRGDVPLFINPGALRKSESEWSRHCVYLLHDFMEHVLGLIRRGDSDGARTLLTYLGEPNETHLGLSAFGEEARGRAVGEEFADLIIDALLNSTAGRTGRINDLEDTVMMIHGIGSDIISDITTNIIRGPLIDYTNDICHSYGVDVSIFVPRHDQAVWDVDSHEWVHPEVLLPIANGRALILVPKFIVRAKVDVDSYFRDYLRDFIAERELENPNSEFVRTLKDKRRVPMRGLIRDAYGTKDKIQALLSVDNMLYEKYNAAVAAGDPRRSQNEMLLSTVNAGSPDLDALLADVTVLPTGNEAFGAYELAIDRLWCAMFSTMLRFPKRQQTQNQGRKRVDIVWTNDANGGFFGWVKTVCPAHFVMAECKNYGAEVGNPEFDQLAGRFGPSKGMLGFLICRHIENKDRAFDRARDLRTDGKGFILPMDDADLRDLVAAAKSGPEQTFEYLQTKFKRVAF